MEFYASKARWNFEVGGPGDPESSPDLRVTSLKTFAILGTFGVQNTIFQSLTQTYKVKDSTGHARASATLELK